MFFVLWLKLQNCTVMKYINPGVNIDFDTKFANLEFHWLKMAV